MERDLKRYAGRTVEIIYIGRDNRITQRRIEIQEVKEGIVKAYCLLRNSPRMFRIDRIMAIQAVKRHAS